MSSLPSANADFDGDTLSFYSPKEKRVIEEFKRGLSPTRLIVDPTGDGYINKESDKDNRLFGYVVQHYNYAYMVFDGAVSSMYSCAGFGWIHT